MADIVNTLDNLIQPTPTRRARHRPGYNTTWADVQPEDLEYDAVQAQIQYDVIERAYMQEVIPPPLQPTPNPKALNACPTCRYLTYEPTFKGRPRLVGTSGIVYLPDKEELVDYKSGWVSRRKQPAEWDLQDDEIKKDCGRFILKKFADDEEQAEIAERKEREKKLEDAQEAEVKARKAKEKLLQVARISQHPQPRRTVKILEPEAVESTLARVSSGDRHRHRLLAFAVKAAEVLLNRKSRVKLEAYRPTRYWTENGELKFGTEKSLGMVSSIKEPWKSVL